MFYRLKELYRYREFMKNRVLRDLKVRYRRSILGLVWTLLNPLLMMLLLTAVFSVIFRAHLPDVSFSAFALTGILFFNLFSESTLGGMNSLIGSAELLKKIYVPKIVFPLSSCLSALINFFFAIFSLFFIYGVTGTSLEPVGILSIISIIFLLLFSAGVSLILSSMAVFFRDLLYIYNVLLTGIFYLTPVFYPESIVPNEMRFLLRVNPLYYLVECFRRPLLFHEIPSPEYYLIGGTCSILSFFIGLYIFDYLEKNMFSYL